MTTDPITHTDLGDVRTVFRLDLEHSTVWTLEIQQLGYFGRWVRYTVVVTDTDDIAVIPANGTKPYRVDGYLETTGDDLTDALLLHMATVA